MPKSGSSKHASILEDNLEIAKPGKYKVWRTGDEPDPQTGTFYAGGKNGIFTAYDYNIGSDVKEYEVTVKNPYTFIGSNSFEMRRMITGESPQKLQKLLDDDEHIIANWHFTDKLVANWASKNGYDAIIYKRPSYESTAGPEIQLLPKALKQAKLSKIIKANDIESGKIKYKP